MIRFYCRCGAEVFFDNSHCGACGTMLGFEPASQALLSLQAQDGKVWRSASTGLRYKLCDLRQSLGCNWLLSADDTAEQCRSCRMTRTIPNLSRPRNPMRWQRLEQTKRRALYMLLRLGLPLDREPAPAISRPLVFDFLEDRRSNPDVDVEIIYSGHRDGVITLNAAEADDSYRVAAREQMNETYRTLLGHFRHELGHYYWDLLLQSNSKLAAFRQLFGDERRDYAAALDAYYSGGPEAGWQEHHISAYASAHPLEDWAESWAHYLHLCDTLETAHAFGVIAGGADNSAPIPFEHRLEEWMRLSVLLNALNRSMGVDDAYPFLLNTAAKRKLQFIDRQVMFWRQPGRIAAER